MLLLSTPTLNKAFIIEFLGNVNAWAQEELELTFLHKACPPHEQTCMGRGGARERKSHTFNWEEMTDQSPPLRQAR